MLDFFFFKRVFLVNFYQARYFIIMWEIFEKILIGVIALLLVMWFMPGIRQSFKEKRETSKSDWMSVVIPLAIVVIFVFFLISVI